MLGGCGDDRVWATELQRGQCADPVDSQGSVKRARLIDCELPHTIEVYAKVDYLSDEAAQRLKQQGSQLEYPSKDALEAFAREACGSRFRSFLGSVERTPDLVLTYLYPSVASWTAADPVSTQNLGPLKHVVGKAPRSDRSVLCAVRASDEKLKGSLCGLGSDECAALRDGD